MPVSRGLTPKQQRFVEEYMLDMNASAAARRAGYSVKTAGWIGQQLLAKTHIGTAVAEGRASLSKRTGRTVEDVMTDIRRRGQLAEQAEEYGAALKAAELEGKHLGAFVEKIEHTGPGGGPLQHVTLTPDEFRAIAVEVARRV